MRAVQEFSRFAGHYEQYNTIQKQVAKRLVGMVQSDDLDTIVDVGCGSGAVYRELQRQQIACQEFWALDLSQEMLALHPQTREVHKLLFDFNASQAFETLPIAGADILISASALQWSSDLHQTLGALSRLSDTAYLAIFTSQTFRTLHKVAHIASPISSAEEIISAVDQHYQATYERVEYRLAFEDIRQMFQYIKRSGVSGGDKQLSYRDMKRIMRTYPHDCLEFEVLFIRGVSKR